MAVSHHSSVLGPGQIYPKITWVNGLVRATEILKKRRSELQSLSKCRGTRDRRRCGQPCAGPARPPVHAPHRQALAFVPNTLISYTRLPVALTPPWGTAQVSPADGCMGSRTRMFIRLDSKWLAPKAVPGPDSSLCRQKEGGRLRNKGSAHGGRCRTNRKPTVQPQT